jgi:hypothetical protein
MRAQIPENCRVTRITIASRGLILYDAPPERLQAEAQLLGATIATIDLQGMTVYVSFDEQRRVRPPLWRRVLHWLAPGAFP